MKNEDSKGSKGSHVSHVSRGQRLTGDSIELQVAMCLQKLGHKIRDDGYSGARFKAMSCGSGGRGGSGSKKFNAFAKKICMGLKRILPPRKSCYFSMMPDTSGSSTSHTRTTSDIVVHASPPIHISIKHNNLSLKHQKSSNLWSQMRMCESRKRKFVAAYNKIETEWHAKWSGYKAFSDLPIEAKRELYDDVNELTVKNLLSCPKKDARGYIDFILDLPAENKYILKCNVEKNKVQVLQLSVPSVPPKSVVKEGNFVIIHLTDGLSIRMRLHSCKTNVTRTLGLKYDTQLRGGGVECIACL